MKQSTAEKIARQVKEGYDKIASEFSATRGYLWGDLHPLAECVKDGDRILDLACGNGRLLELFKGKKIDYVGIDSCEALIEKAKDKLPKDSKFKIQNSIFIVGDMLNLPFADGSFDAVFCVAALHHLPSRSERRKALAEMRRVLKPGGILTLTAWNLWQKKYAAWFFDCKNKIKFGAYSPKDLFIPWKLKSGEIVWRYCHAFTRGELRRLLGKSGLAPLKIYSSGRNVMATATKCLTDFQSDDKLVVAK